MKLLGTALCAACLLALAASTLSLTGCETWKGFGKDVSTTGEKIEGKNEITVNGPDGKQMTVVIPRSITIHRGQTQTFTIEIRRQNFTGPVRIALSQLPNGVKADMPSKPVEADSVACTLKADAAADLVKNQAVNINAVAIGANGMGGTRSFELTVKE